MNSTLAGGFAGLAATAPMSLAMQAMFPALPAHEQYPLPPRLITEHVAEKAGVDEQLDESQEHAATWAAHFAYGATVGAIYGTVAPVVPLPWYAKGIGFGLAVWAGSYLGLLPAAGLLPSATHQPAERNALMIAAHVVWGATTGLITERLTQDGGSPSSSAASVGRTDPSR